MDGEQLRKETFDSITRNYKKSMEENNDYKERIGDEDTYYSRPLTPEMIMVPNGVVWSEPKEPPAEATAMIALLKESHLELTEAEQIKQSYLPFFVQMAEIKEESKKISFDNPGDIDEVIARNLRIRTMKIRTGSEAIKVDRKRIHMLKADVEQKTWNLIAADCKLAEEQFAQVEKRKEILEKKRQAELKAQREELLKEFVEDVSLYPLGTISQESFDQLLNGFKLAAKQKEEQAAKELEERLAREKVQQEEQERIKAENERLRAEAAEKERLLAIERAEQIRIAQEQEKALQAEREKAAAELQAREKIAAAERAEAAKELKAQQDKADAEKWAAEKLRKIAEDKARLEQDELKAAQELQLKKERDERLKIAQELADKKAQEEKAASDLLAAQELELSKGDKEKLDSLLSDMEALKGKYTFKSKKHKDIQVQVNLLLDKVINYAISKQ
jgi:hypothetical protein